MRNEIYCRQEVSFNQADLALESIEPPAEVQEPELGSSDLMPASRSLLGSTRFSASAIHCSSNFGKSVRMKHPKTIVARVSNSPLNSIVSLTCRSHLWVSPKAGSSRGAWLAVLITRAVRSAPETSSYLAGIFSLSLNRRWLAVRVNCP